MTNNPILNSIEESFAMLIARKGSVDKELQNIGRNLSKLLEQMYHKKYTFTVDFCEKVPHTFFGMSIYPSVAAMSGLLDNIFDENPNIDSIINKWNTNTEWTIEIDTMLLFDRNLNINPAEATAVLLHEVGHIMGTNTVPLRLQRCIRNKLTNLNIKTRKMVEMKEVRPLLSPAIIEACSTKMYKYVGSREELAADKYAKSLGYGNQLNAFLDKIIRIQGNSLMQTTEHDALNDINCVMDWSIEAIDEMKYRKTKLKHSLKMQMLSTPSKFTKRILSTIRERFFSPESIKSYDDRFGVLESSIFAKYDRVKINESVYDSISRKADKIVTESLFSKSNKKLKKIDPLDIDYINIEIDKILNHDDKIYVLDLIYYQMSLIDKANEMIDEGKGNLVQNTKRDLERYREELLRLRERAVNVRIVKRNPLDINIRVDYPKGFEG